jgi:hypothetical protein
MAIRLKHLEEIRRDADLVVLKVIEPGAVAANRIRQKLGDLAQAHRNAAGRGEAVQDAGGFVVLSENDAQRRTSHRAFSPGVRENRAADDSYIGCARWRSLAKISEFGGDFPLFVPAAFIPAKVERSKTGGPSNFAATLRRCKMGGWWFDLRPGAAVPAPSSGRLEEHDGVDAFPGA